MLQIIKNTGQAAQILAQMPLRAFMALRYALGYFPEEDHLPTSQDVEKLVVPTEDAMKHISFTYAVISLAAQVARESGQVSRAEYLAFRDSFPLTGGMCAKIRELFLHACRSATPYSQHVRHIKQLFPGKRDLYATLVERLFRIATADAALSREEELLLRKIAHMLGLNPNEYSKIYDTYSRPLKPHYVLGVKKRERRATIKKRYHALMQRYHPDKFTHEETSPEVQLILTLKTSEISRAYSQLTRKAA